MQSLPGLLNDLMRRGITFSLSDGGIAYRDPKNRLSQTDKDYLRGIREELKLHLLAERAAATPHPDVNAHIAVPSLTQECWWNWVRQDPNQKQNNRIRVVKAYRDKSLTEVLAAVRAVIASNDVLRTRFEDRGEGPVVRLNEPGAFEIEVDHLVRSDVQNVDLSRLAEDFSDDLPIDGKWLAKAKILVTPGALILVAVFHHILVDGFSIRLLLEQLEADVPASQPVSRSSFYDYANAQQCWLKQSGSILVDYWKSWLNRQHHLVSPETGARLEWCAGEHVEHTFSLGPEVHRKVRELSLKFRSTPMLMYLCVYAISLSKWSGQRQFPLRCLTSARYTENIWSIVGNFNTADPIEVRIPMDSDFETVLRGIQIEYSSSLARRLPGMLTFPAQSVGGEREKFSQSIAATINYFPNMPSSAEGTDSQSVEHAWPPLFTINKPTEWRIPLWPIYLRLSPKENGCLGVFQFNGKVIGPEHQNTLRDVFFEELAKLLGMT
jgi:hypothetical protein